MAASTSGTEMATCEKLTAAGALMMLSFKETGRAANR